MVCPICRIKDSEPLLILKCGHMFHKGCIEKWMHDWCLMCREPIEICEEEKWHYRTVYLSLFSSGIVGIKPWIWKVLVRSKSTTMTYTDFNKELQKELEMNANHIAYLFPQIIPSYSTISMLRFMKKHSHLLLKDSKPSKTLFFSKKNNLIHSLFNSKT